MKVKVSAKFLRSVELIKANKILNGLFFNLSEKNRPLKSTFYQEYPYSKSYEILNSLKRRCLMIPYNKFNNLCSVFIQEDGSPSKYRHAPIIVSPGLIDSDPFNNNYGSGSFAFHVDNDDSLKSFVHLILKIEK